MQDHATRLVGLDGLVVTEVQRIGEQLDLQVELLADPLHFGHDEAIQPDEAGSVVLHPLFLLAPRSLDHAKPQRGSGRRGCPRSRRTLTAVLPPRPLALRA